MDESLGAWVNAPLAYVLAEVRTEILSDLNDYQASIAKQLRQVYPIQRKMNLSRLVATGTQVIFEQEQDHAWEFASPNNRIAVILRANGIVLHATAYTDSQDFLGRLHHALTVFSEIPSIYINRVGIRYIDFILPKQNETPEDYINEKLNPDLGLSEGRKGYAATNIASYPMERGQLNIRYMRGNGQPMLPPDLGILTLEPSHLMKPGLLTDDQPTAILDTDRIMEFSPVERLDAAKVHGLFMIMREDIRRAFRGCAITDHAKKVWGAV